MSTLAERVTHAREARGWSQAELARRVSARRGMRGKSAVRQQSVNQLEQGEVDAPRYLLELAEVLEVDAAWLSGHGHGDPPPPAVPAAGLVQAPLISWVEAGGLTETVDAYPPGEAAEWVPVFHRHDKLIALTVRGQSMDKIAPEGTTIIVDLTDRTLVDGRHYVFRHEGRATFKTWRKGPPPRLEPQSTDPEYLAIAATDGVEVVGRVIRKTEEI
ncbi:XRE family transcriptional regulator [Iodidimonas sp. SYSU 1G8]|uniref:XRE family transcriptional regulator n=1 Tax=Iodidimonas sp. SYSU 1G8 TaxID=3133967 RepID=UPI0031FE8EA0